LRTPIFVPGNRANMLEKALGFQTDWVVCDLEDSVPEPEKNTARELVPQFTPRLAASRLSVMVRVNDLTTGRIEEDLHAVVSESVSAISVGKVRSTSDIGAYEDLLASAERAAGVTVGTTGLVPWIENAPAVQNAFAIAMCSPRILALAFGGEDYTAAVGIPRTAAGDELRFPKSMVALAAHAAGVVPLDTPYVDFRNTEGLTAECIAARQMGYKGKFAIHPGQIAGIKQVFSPSESEVAEARRLIAEWDKAVANGRGSFDLDGKMVDAPVIERARGTLRDAGLN
jgi:citrate lyase subunit beta/citryl-CoA lyase